MTITYGFLLRAAAVAAAAAGLIFIGVQINHPSLDATSITTTDVMIRNSLKMVMAALALAGITGVYLFQVTKIGVLGLIGYVVFAAGYLSMLGTEYVAALVLPSIAHSSTAYVNDVIAVATNQPATGDIGAMQGCHPVHRTHLHRRWRPLRHRPLPCKRPRPLGVGAPRRWHPVSHRCRHRSAVRAAVRHPDRPRLGRPRLLPVARAAHLGCSACPRPCQLGPRPGRSW